MSQAGLKTQPEEAENMSFQSFGSDDESSLHGVTLNKEGHTLPKVLGNRDERKPDWDKFVKFFYETDERLHHFYSELKLINPDDDEDWRVQNPNMHRGFVIGEMLLGIQDSAAPQLIKMLSRIGADRHRESEPWYRDQLLQCGAFSIMMGGYLIKMASLEAGDEFDICGRYFLMLLKNCDIQHAAKGGSKAAKKPTEEGKTPSNQLGDGGVARGVGRGVEDTDTMEAN